MADEEQEESGGGKKKLLIIGAPILLLVLGGGGFFMMSSGGAEGDTPTTTLAPVEGAVIDAVTMTVNLSGEELHYARVSFAVVMSEAADSGAVGARMPLLQDAVLPVIAKNTPDDLRSPTGLAQLRADITGKALEVFTDGEVLRAVLTEVIVQ